MTTKVEKTLLVDVPVRVAYNQWTQFEEFPQFMDAVKEVKQLGDRRLHWVAEIAGVKREWDATILEQVPDVKVAWAATEGATNAGAVYFSPAGETQTTVTLSLEYEPEGLLEKVGDKMDIVEKNAEADLERFKTFIESRGYESGGWRGAVNVGGAGGTPGVEAAASTRGDSGKAGLSGAAKAAGAAGVAAAGVAAASALKGTSENKEEEVVVVEETVATDVQPAPVAPAPAPPTQPMPTEPVAPEPVAPEPVETTERIEDRVVVENPDVVGEPGGPADGGGRTV